MNDTMNFTHKNESLSAVIIRTPGQHNDVRSAAEAAFKECGIDGDVKVRLLKDRIEGDSQPGYREFYAIYESYVDAGSVDYYYFAVATYAEVIA